MEIKAHDRGDVRVLELDGRLSLGGGAAAVHEDVRRELDEGHHQLLLAMAQVDAIDSTGLGVLVSCLTSARHRGGNLKLLQPTPRVGDILEITQADQLFEIFEDEDQAIRSFS
mgnify:CR=1 FL=1